MCYLKIWDQTYFSDDACNPELYTEIVGIRELCIDKVVQDKADEMGIDWYSYWPELETIEIPETAPGDVISRAVKNGVGDSFAYLGEESRFVLNYYFKINKITPEDIGNFVEACNAYIYRGENKYYNFWVYYDDKDNDGRYPLLFTIRNSSDGNYGDELHDGMYCLQISDQAALYDEACNPELYSEIEGIKELHVARTVQDKADEMGIDWYEYWPELETIVVEDE